MEGRIKTFLPSKAYGFIDGDDGKSYFFHVQDFKSAPAKIEENLFVAFEEAATPKGYRAKNVDIVDSLGHFAPVTKFVYSRKRAPKGLDVRFSAMIQSVDKDLRAAEDGLRDMARQLGGNGLINVTYSKFTESKGNYQYTVHRFRGECVVLGEHRFAKEPHVAAQGEKDLEALVKTVQANVAAMREAEEREAERLRKRRRRLFWGAAIVVVGFIIALMALG